MYHIYHKEVDEQGRILLPREWRHTLRSRKVIVIVDGATVKVLPTGKKLSSFFDKVKPSDLEPSPFKDYWGSLAEASRR